MPTYSYICECGNTFEKSSSVKNYRNKRKCSVCKKMAQHSVILDHKNGNVNSQMMAYSMEGSTGTRLYPASYLPSQIDEARKKHPGTDFILHNGCFLPKIRNRTHKLKYLKERGFCELD